MRWGVDWYQAAVLQLHLQNSQDSSLVLHVQRRTVQEGGAGRAGNTTQSTNHSSAPSEDGLVTTAERSTLVAVGQGGDGQRS